VSFLNAVDAGNTDVTFLIDCSVFGCDRIGVHPNDNTATVTLKPHDIQRILDACGGEYRFLALESDGPVISRAREEDASEILRLQYAAYQSEAAIYDDYSIQPLTQTLEQATAEFQGGVVL
jgi:hypothetical protein